MSWIGQFGRMSAAVLVQYNQANNSVNPTVRPVTARAMKARPAPVRPAGYADRSDKSLDIPDSV